MECRKQARRRPVERMARRRGPRGRGGVMIHPRGLPAAVVEQVQLTGQGLGSGTPACADSRQATSLPDRGRTATTMLIAAPTTRAGTAEISASASMRPSCGRGAASALISGLAALVGVLVSRWLFKLPVLAPRQDGAYGDVRTTALILVAVAAAIVATAVVHLLMLGSLRPLMFFGWIVALVTTIAVIFP